MNLLLVTERYWPSVGGVETVTRLLAASLLRAGHRATILTNQHGTATYGADSRVVRRPGILCLLRLYAGADAVVVQGPALRLAWPLLCNRRNALIVHHTFPADLVSSMSKRLHAQLRLRARQVTVSKAMAQALPFPIAAILPNPYDCSVFRIYPGLRRNKDIVFVGRLIREKGADVLIQAIAILNRAGKPVGATIVGDGPERERLRQLSRTLGIASRLCLAGQITGDPLARLLNEHRILVVPSVCQESFGLVALEGAACGCAVVASDIGGLPEAVGECGLLFLPGNAASLAEGLAQVLESDSLAQSFRLNSAGHLKRHAPAAVAESYLCCLSRGQSQLTIATARQPVIHAVT
jgi:glycogen(starch) synthase